MDVTRAMFELLVDAATKSVANPVVAPLASETDIVQLAV